MFKTNLSIRDWGLGDGHVFEVSNHCTIEKVFRNISNCFSANLWVLIVLIDDPCVGGIFAPRRGTNRAF